MFLLYRGERNENMRKIALKKSVTIFFVSLCFLGTVFIYHVYQMSLNMNTSPCLCPEEQLRQPKTPHKIRVTPIKVWIPNHPRNRTTPKPTMNSSLPMNRTTNTLTSNSSNLFPDILDFIKGIPKETRKKGKKSTTNLFAFISKILNETWSHDEQRQQYFKYVYNNYKTKENDVSHVTLRKEEKIEYW